MVASLFRAVPLKDFEARVKPIFRNLQKEWGVPLVVLDDDGVTVLAGAMSLGRNAMLGTVMASSEAVGFLDRPGSLPGWLTELAFAPVDYNPGAAAVEWSGDHVGGALHFSQQAVNKLAPAAVSTPTICRRESAPAEYEGNSTQKVGGFIQPAASRNVAGCSVQIYRP